MNQNEFNKLIKSHSVSELVQTGWYPPPVAGVPALLVVLMPPVLQGANAVAHRVVFVENDAERARVEETLNKPFPVIRTATGQQAINMPMTFEGLNLVPSTLTQDQPGLGYVCI